LKWNIAREEDFGVLAEYVLIWAREHGFKADRNLLIDSMKSSDIVLFAEEGDKMVGAMAGHRHKLFWQEETFAVDDWFFVDPKYKGVAYFLHLAFCSWAKLAGCKSVLICPNRFGTMDVDDVPERLKKYGFDMYGYQMRKEL